MQMTIEIGRFASCRWPMERWEWKVAVVANNNVPWERSFVSNNFFVTQIFCQACFRSRQPKNRDYARLSNCRANSLQHPFAGISREWTANGCASSRPTANRALPLHSQGELNNRPGHRAEGFDGSGKVVGSGPALASQSPALAGLVQSLGQFVEPAPGQYTQVGRQLFGDLGKMEQVFGSGRVMFRQNRQDWRRKKFLR